MKCIFVCLDLSAVAVTIPDYRAHIRETLYNRQDSKKFDCPAKIRLRIEAFSFHESMSIEQVRVHKKKVIWVRNILPL